MKPSHCNYYLTFRSNDTPEYSSLWREPELTKLEEAPFESIKNNLGDLAKLGIRKIMFEGGEPLLREDLPLILAVAKEWNQKIHLTTNGILFAERAKEIAPYLEEVSFWLDSPVEEDHDRIRGVECFKEVGQGINLCRKLGVTPKLRFALTRDSVRFLPELEELAEAAQIEVYLNPIYDKKYHPLLFESITLDHIKYFKAHPLIKFDFSALEFIKQRGNQRIMPRCKAVSSVVTIFPDNSLAFPCFYLPEKRVNLKDDLFKVYTSPGFLRQLEKGQGRFDECQNCLAFSYFLPSFSKKYDRYFLLQLYSDFINKRKLEKFNARIALKEGASKQTLNSNF